MNLIPKLEKSNLDSLQYHYKIAPKERIEAVQKLNISHQNPSKAGVMALFYPKNNQLHIVLIVRPSYPGVHSSQISFPGGRYEANDSSFMHTALRECHEEVGIVTENIKIIKALREVYIPPSNFLMHPFMGFATKELTFTPQESEVKNILEIPFDFFLNQSNLIDKTMNTSYGVQISVKGWEFNNHFIWGATAMVLSEIVGLFDSIQ